MIAPIEIKAAIERARTDAAPAGDVNLADAVAQLFGLPAKPTLRKLIVSLLS